MQVGRKPDALVSRTPRSRTPAFSIKRTLGLCTLTFFGSACWKQENTAPLPSSIKAASSLQLNQAWQYFEQGTDHNVHSTFLLFRGILLKSADTIERHAINLESELREITSLLSDQSVRLINIDRIALLSNRYDFQPAIDSIRAIVHAIPTAATSSFFIQDKAVVTNPKVKHQLLEFLYDWEQSPAYFTPGEMAQELDYVANRLDEVNRNVKRFLTEARDAASKLDLALANQSIEFALAALTPSAADLFSPTKGLPALVEGIRRSAIELHPLASDTAAAPQPVPEWAKDEWAPYTSMPEAIESFLFDSTSERQAALEGYHQRQKVWETWRSVTNNSQPRNNYRLTPEQIQRAVENAQNKAKQK